MVVFDEMFHHPVLFGIYMFLILPIIVWILVFFAFLGVTFFVGVVAGVIVNFTFLCIALLMLVIVPELGPLVAVLAISAEPSPPGSFTIMSFPGKRKKQLLWHSMVYADSGVRQVIADWMQR